MLLLVPLTCLALFLIYCCAPWWQEEGPVRDSTGTTVRFAYIDDRAASVCVAGSFNAWSEHRNCMRKQGDRWSLAVTLTPGRYQYVMIIDGHLWREDPGNPLAEDDGFGARNSVLVIE